MLSFPGMQDVMRMFMPEDSNPYSTIIQDYITSCELQEIPDPKTYYEAIVMAVDEGMKQTWHRWLEISMKNGEKVPSKKILACTRIVCGV